MNTLSFAFAVALCLSCRGNAVTSRVQAHPSARAADAVATPKPAAAWDELDQRRPVPLLPVIAQHQKENMRAHLEAVEQVVAGAAAGDFDEVATAARRMGYSESMGRTWNTWAPALPASPSKPCASTTPPTKSRWPR